MTDMSGKAALTFRIWYSESFSPPTRIIFNPRNTVMSFSTNWLNQLEVNHMVETFFPVISSFSEVASSSRFSSQNTSCPPLSNIDQYSKVVASKDGDPVDNKISSGDVET